MYVYHCVTLLEQQRANYETNPKDTPADTKHARKMCDTDLEGRVQ